MVSGRTGEGVPAKIDGMPAERAASMALLETRAQELHA
jgi:hypothetical protein